MQPLFEKYLNNTITEEEMARLHAYFGTQDNQEELEALLEAHFSGNPNPQSPQIEDKAQILADRTWEKIREHLALPAPPRVRRASWWPAVTIAASLVLVTSIAFYFLKGSAPQATQPVAIQDRDIPPGSSRAELISSSGKVLQLSGAKEEILVSGNSIQYKDGVRVSAADSSETVTLRTPRGGQYRVTLSDGTRVWLNAASSIAYPTQFSGTQRKVELTGEAYFEVAHNPEKPFIVHTETEDIRVLGTSFNVNAYHDEDKTVTTLLTGRVQLSKMASAATAELKPGEQAVLQKGAGSSFELEAVDAELFSAWKDGEFRFKAIPLAEALRQLERWYDLDIDYNGIPEDIRVHASIKRNRKLSTVIHALERITDLKFEIKGRSVKIMQ